MDPGGRPRPAPHWSGLFPWHTEDTCRTGGTDPTERKEDTKSTERLCFRATVASVIIAVANLKGGVGKTTAAVYLAEAASMRGSVLLVDADPQGSAMAWADAASAGRTALASVALALPTPDLARRLPHLLDGHRHIVIDTPPGDVRIVRAAVEAADLVLIPTRPTLLDVDRVQATLALTDDAGRPAAVLLSQVRRGTRSLAAARGAFDAAELPLLAVEVPAREAIAASFGVAPAGEGLAIFADVLAELEEATT